MSQSMNHLKFRNSTGKHPGTAGNRAMAMMVVNTFLSHQRVDMSSTQRTFHFCTFYAETHGGKNCLLDNGDVKNVIFRQKDDWITGSISGIQDSSECLDIKVISTSEQPTTTYPSTEPQRM